MWRELRCESPWLAGSIPCGGRGVRSEALRPAPERRNHSGRAAMLEDAVLAVWEFHPKPDLGLATRCALDYGEPPDMHVVVESSTGDMATVSITSGRLTDPESLQYVERRGLFEIVGTEAWTGPGETGRTLLRLRAFPSR